MDPIYFVIVIILMFLAVSDLMVGVANDAVNFLNSAVGSKAAPRRVILWVATTGILVGVLTSGGMMEVARSGVFYPSMFTFANIMILFLAVMLTDVILLDLFNTLGLPTSTTVSLVFELLGAAVCISLFKIADSSTETLTDLSQYINSSKALAIISGILISVVIAFICGMVVMYLSRLIFTFNYKTKVKTIIPIWASIALTAITYFIVFKGLKSAPFMPAELMNYINTNIWLCIVYAFAFWSIVMFGLAWLKVNVLKITVLSGTFALALAFAGNDLVNFIGVFMAGYDSFNIASQTGDVNMTMELLSEPVKANVWILLISGLIMVITLWFNKKARKVTETEVNLSRQESGTERFDSTHISRILVRAAVNLNKGFNNILPKSVILFINSRFSLAKQDLNEQEQAPFDLLRATVNLTIAALLISLATSLKLPLSTTYVSFMVAMGTSLADRAWGRESAVYRITGVITVISGWFLTAFIAFAIAFLVTALLMWGSIYAGVLLVALCVFLLIKTNFNKKEKKQKLIQEQFEGLSLVERCTKGISDSMNIISNVYNKTLQGVFNEDRRLLKKTLEESKELYQWTHEQKYGVSGTLQEFKEQNIETGHFFVQVVDYLNEVAKSLLHISKASFEHIDNNHSGFSKEQIDDLSHINAHINLIFEKMKQMIQTNNFTQIEQVIDLGDRLFDDLAEAIKQQIRRNKNKQNTTRSSALYLELLTEIKITILQLRNLLKAQKYFIERQSVNLS